MCTRGLERIGWRSDFKGGSSYPQKDLNFTAPGIVTGDHNSCSETITVKDATSIEPL